MAFEAAQSVAEQRIKTATELSESGIVHRAGSFENCALKKDESVSVSCGTFFFFNEKQIACDSWNCRP